jgi:diguanylate cyclase (GGDEF)-like protein
MLQSLAGISIALIAEATSTIAEGLAAELRDLECRVHRCETGEAPAPVAEAGVVVVETPAAATELQTLLAQSSVPLLVVATSRQIADSVVTSLEERHDLATVADTPAVLSWRLRHLVALARRDSGPSGDIDALTGLQSRRAFQRRLRQALAWTTPDQSAGLLYVDLDEFKRVNERFGHVVGDQVLIAVASLLTRSLRPEDVIARMGGDEFACLLTRHSSIEVARDAEQLLDRLAQSDVPCLAREPSLRLSASAGLTFLRPEASAEETLLEADVAMYEVKCSGRGKLSVYDSGDDVVSAGRPDLRVEHFERATRLATERLVESITLRGRRLIDEAKREANCCALTGLYNRRFFDTKLARELVRARYQGRPLSIVMIDMDHFSDVNGTYGWPTGDRVLKKFASVALANARSTDWIARYGGEEFVIVMPDTEAGSAQQVADRVRAAFASGAVESMDGEPVVVTLSAGVAQLSEAMDTPTQFVQQASKALLHAKSGGRNRVELAA